MEANTVPKSFLQQAPQLYTESIKLKYLCNGSYFVKRHSLPMNTISLMGLGHSYHSPTLNELNWVWTCEKSFSNGSLEGLIDCFTCWVFLWSEPRWQFLSDQLTLIRWAAVVERTIRYLMSVPRRFTVVGSLNFKLFQRSPWNGSATFDFPSSH